jgi:hypothetical protein
MGSLQTTLVQVALGCINYVGSRRRTSLALSTGMGWIHPIIVLTEHRNRRTGHQ